MIALPKTELKLELQNWLKTNPPPSYTENTVDGHLSEFVRVGKLWQRQLASGRWVGVSWPEKYGGRGLTLVDEGGVQEELVSVSAPQLIGLFGISMVGPVLIHHGTEYQRQRFLPKILTGEELWCQGFSEPGAGSDLAAVSTRAEKVSDGYIITGQKVWTSFAHIADFCFILCRTSTGTKKHHGLSYFLVDMKQPGITVRPLKQISGDDEFNEVFFDKVLVPATFLVGVEGAGWEIALTTLMHERVILTFSRLIQSEICLKELLSTHVTGKDVDIAHANACAVRALAYKQLSAYSAGITPGPEGSMVKLLWSESFQHLSKIVLSRHARNALLSELLATQSAKDLHRYLYSRGRTLAAGTSEIQRSIISSRILGLI